MTLHDDDREATTTAPTPEGTAMPKPTLTLITNTNFTGRRGPKRRAHFRVVQPDGTLTRPTWRKDRPARPADPKPCPVQLDPAVPDPFANLDLTYDF